MSVVTQTVAGKVDAISIAPGESIEQTITRAWSGHVAAHLECCGAVSGPLADWVCQQGHPLYQ